MINAVLFDLDGTITDSQPGITNCVKYGLESFGIYETDYEKLNAFIGPPLLDMYMELYGFSRDDALFAVSKYRERYTEKGIYENKLYDGICDILKMLKKKNITICLATAKPQNFAEIILDYFDITKYFDIICGCEIEGPRDTKTKVIASVLDNLKNQSSIMVGDRKYDIISAHECFIPCIGVKYGYGKKTELTDACADYIADDIEGLKNILSELT